jgi:hypothetical protein
MATQFPSGESTAEAAIMETLRSTRKQWSERELVADVQSRTELPTTVVGRALMRLIEESSVRINYAGHGVLQAE